MKNNILTLSIAQIAKKLRSRELSSVDVVKACLAQAEKTTHLNAWNSLYSEQALSQASAWQSLLDSGIDLGPLQGIPIGLKANIDVAGHTMHAGSQLLSDNIASANASVTTRLQRAGAIILGTTNMHEFAWGGTTDNPHYGATSNPWNDAHIPAGSSGGSGVASAVRSALATLGTDTGGSVRLPASMNGVTGLRPGIGQIPTDGVFPLAWTMDTVGPLAPSAQECALVYSVLSAKQPPKQVKPLNQLKVGLLSGYATEVLQPDVRDAYQLTIRQWQALGAQMVELDLDGLDYAVDAAITIDAAEPSAIHWQWVKEKGELYGDDVRALLLAGGGISAVEYLQAQRYRSYLREQFLAAFAKVDAILMPMIPFTAPVKGATSIDVGNSQLSVLSGNMRFTSLPSMSAMPGASFPVGCDSEGLPIGMQLMGTDHSEFELLAWIGEYQDVHPYHQVRPAVAQL
ncbi:amidase [Celerinatantimonas sp. MCCC 1A17872]|uniref:amidase n=1 Tax=Celerinatantimonas sp. MCCC 1A17872 TaxID=3177514 RepID=UPI0038CADC71